MFFRFEGLRLFILSVFIASVALADERPTLVSGVPLKPSEREACLVAVHLSKNAARYLKLRNRVITRLRFDRDWWPLTKLPELSPAGMVGAKSRRYRTFKDEMRKVMKRLDAWNEKVLWPMPESTTEAATQISGWNEELADIERRLG